MLTNYKMMENMTDKEKRTSMLVLKAFAVWVVLVVVFNILKATSDKKSKLFEVSSTILDVLYGIMIAIFVILLVIFGGGPLFSG